MQQKPRVLFLGLGLYGTGFYRVLNSLLVRLAGSYDLHLFRLGGSEESRIDKALVQTHEGFIHFDDPGLRQVFSGVIDKVKPGMVFLFGQPWWLRPFLEELQRYRKDLIIVNYIPVEGKLVNPEICDTIGMSDYCIAYTEFTKDNLLSLCRSYMHTTPRFNIPQFYVLPHGVDSDIFYPVAERKPAGEPVTSRAAIRRQLFAGMPQIEDAFIVLNANHPYYRKRLDITLKGFAEFAKNKPSNVFLYLHHISISDYERKQMQILVNDLELNDRVLFNVLNPLGKPLPEEKLNLLYNACDVGVTTSMGEGWGLATFEHAATGAAQIVPAHTSFIENWSGAACMLEINSTEYLGDEFTEGYVPGSASLALKLDELYNNRDYLNRMSAVAYSKASGTELNWSYISTQLHQILQKIFSHVPEEVPGLI